MTDHPDDSAEAKSIARSRQELNVARLLARNGYARQAVSRAYYASFYVAEAAVVALGETRSKHTGVISAFGRLVVREGGFDKETGRVLRRLFLNRNEADYEFAEMDVAEAETAIADAARFVDAIEVWLSERAR